VAWWKFGSCGKAKHFLFDHSEINQLHSCRSRKPYNRMEWWVVMWLKRLLISGGTPYPPGGKCFLTEPFCVLKLTSMEVHLKPETASRLAELAAKNGRATDELMEDAMAGYLQELTETREMFDSRYDDIKGGRVAPIDGETFFDNLRRREDELLKKRNLK
jgi:predicted transcriptional regulator